MDEADMVRVREAFVDAAKRSVRIGFESIELHMAHGYLLHSFVSPISNKRNDDYGGSLEGRMSFRSKCCARCAPPCRRACRSARVSPARTGWTAASPAMTPSRGCRHEERRPRLRLRFLRRRHRGGAHADHARLQRADRRADQARDRHRDACGRLIATAKQAEAIVAEGKADMIALGRAMLEDPHWAWLAAKELGAESRARCNICARRRNVAGRCVSRQRRVVGFFREILAAKIFAAVVRLRQYVNGFDTVEHGPQYV